MKQVEPRRLPAILEQRRRDAGNLEGAVASIIEQVRRDGDKAIRYFSSKFDRADLKSIRVSESEMTSARHLLRGDFGRAVTAAAQRIAIYHRAQLPKTKTTVKENGCRVTFRCAPIRRIGVYIPASQAPLVSSLLMTVIPAQVTGCRDICVCSPPAHHNSIHPLLLAVLSKLKLRNVFAVGGAQAIAALAYGTKTIPRVDKIVGPGPSYVNTAKKLLSGVIGIDSLAGPSEVVIFADDTGNPSFIAEDLKAQLEHTDGAGILITTSRKLADTVSDRVAGGYVVRADDRRQALELINEIRPEHLQVVCRNPGVFAEQAVAGAIFVGNYSPTAFGDYYAGPSHILPTAGAAAFSSGLSVHTFLRTYAVIEADRKFIRKHGPHIKALADAEGLAAHAKSIEIRMRSERTRENK